MTAAAFDTPADDRWFEDYPVGAVYEFGEATLTEDAIIEFARQWDPQVYHVDREGAKEHFYGGIIASGWHTGCTMMRMYVDHYLSTVAALGSPGVDEVRWPMPTLPGDTLRLRVSIESARRSRSKPDRGIVISRVEVLNQRDEVAMSMKATNLFLCRSQPDAPEGGPG